MTDTKLTTNDHPTSTPPGCQSPETKGKSTIRYVAYCGIDCTKCPQYRNGCEEGCLGNTTAQYCGTCEIRKCNLARQIANCAACAEYPCSMLENFFAELKANGYAEWEDTAKASLGSIRLQQHSKIL